MREVNSPDYHSYLHLVMDGSRGQVEWEILVDRLTVHETRFYRDTHSLDLIRDKYLSELVQERSTDRSGVGICSVFWHFVQDNSG